jgi:hypothetical protein
MLAEPRNSNSAACAFRLSVHLCLGRGRVSSSAATLAWSEPLTTLPRSARSRVSFTRSFCKAACEDTRPLPVEIRKLHARRRGRRSRLPRENGTTHGPTPVRARPRSHEPLISRTLLRSSDQESGGVSSPGNIQRATRRRATERSEGALLAAPPERALLPKRILRPTTRPRSPVKGRRLLLSLSQLFMQQAVRAAIQGRSGVQIRPKPSIFRQ